MKKILNVMRTKSMHISIPKGSDDNEIITIKDKGNILANNINGDVKVFIKVINNTPFTRNGLDLIYKKYLFKRFMYFHLIHSFLMVKYIKLIIN